MSYCYSNKAILVIESYINGLKYLILTLEYAPIPISYRLKMSL